MQIKKTLAIPQNKKSLLIASGGEGLKNADEILSVFLKNNFTEQIIIICGKNKVLKHELGKIVSSYNAQNVLIFGFVIIMYELINLSDCIVSKGDHCTVMEVLSLKKPLIISDFVRYQEWGNVFFFNNIMQFFYTEAERYIQKGNAAFFRRYYAANIV